MKLTADQSKLREIFFSVITEHTNNLIVLPATNKKTGAKTVIVCLIYDVDGEDQVIPFCFMVAQEDNPWDMYEFGLAQNMEIYPEEHVEKSFWKPWTWLRK